MQQRNEPHNELPLLPPKLPPFSTSLTNKLVSARVALAELKIAGKIIPNQSVIINTIGLQEAKLSSEIENIVTTNDELYKALSEESARSPSEITPQTKEVLSYNRAMWHALTAMRKRPICTSLMEEISSIIKGRNMKVRSNFGTKIANPVTGEVIYIPPEGEDRIRDLLRNLEEYINNHADETDPLIKMAVAHYQFEAIHPFNDGNGRTGRIINILYLLDRDLLELPTLYLSKYIIENKAGYYIGLKGVTEENDWEGWIKYILEAVEKTSISTKEKMFQIDKAIQEVSKIVKDKAPDIYSLDLIVEIFKQPYSRIALIEKSLGKSRQTASKYLNTLEKIGVLSSVQIGREKYFINEIFLKLLSN